MKLYQVLVPAFLCVLAIIVTRTDAQQELTALRSKMYQITKELEARMREYEDKEDGDLQFDEEKRGSKKAPRPWNSLYGQTGISFGKRGDDVMERTRNQQRDQRAKSRYMFGHSALGFGKRTEYPQQQDLWDLEGIANADLEDFVPVVQIPVKKAMGFTGNTGILFGKRTAETEVE